MDGGGLGSKSVLVQHLTPNRHSNTAHANILNVATLGRWEKRNRSRRRREGQVDENSAGEGRMSRE